MKSRVLFLMLSVALVLVAVGATVASGPVRPLAPRPGRLLGQLSGPPTNQIIVKFRATASDEALAAGARDALLADLSRTAGEALVYVRPMSGDAHVLSVAEARPPAEMAVVSARLDARPDVEYAEPDLIKGIDLGSLAPAPATPLPALADLTPNDTLYGDQWHYMYAPGTAEGLNLPPAWSITTGLTTTVVAVIDTGILGDHPDLVGRTVPGYDMISSVAVANDGDGRDADPSDPGDWVAAFECGSNDAHNSSWHGTHVAGTIGAASNNGVGVAGINWQAEILPVRVLGKCGGYTSDIVDGVRWAAGLSVPSTPANANPADVINLSLGGLGSCEASEQSAFDDAVAAGATVVIAAGNSQADASLYSPGNCNNVITVAATNRTGNKAYYSNYGSVVEVSAPGGETNNQASSGVLSTLNLGAQSPGTHSYAYYQGTSMAAPHVAGLASLIKALEPGYSQADVLDVLQTYARAFPAGSSCSTSNCGTGIVDAYRILHFLDPSVEIHYTHLPFVTTEYQQQVYSVPNGDFEQGPTIWTEFSEQGWPLIMTVGDGLPIEPRGGQYAVWLGGGDNEFAYIEQTLTIPAAAPHLTYWHWINSADECGWDFAGVFVNGSTVVDVYDLCTTENTLGWVKHSVNLSAYNGQSVDVAIFILTDTELETESSLLVDDVTFAASAAPPASAGPVGRSPESPAYARGQ